MYKVLSIFAIGLLCTESLFALSTDKCHQLQKAIENSTAENQLVSIDNLCATIKNYIQGCNESKDMKLIFQEHCTPEEEMQSDEDPNPSSAAVSLEVLKKCYEHIRALLGTLKEDFRRANKESFKNDCAAYLLNIELCDYSKDFKENMQKYYKTTCDNEQVKKWLADSGKGAALTLRAASAHIIMLTVMATSAGLFI